MICRRGISFTGASSGAGTRPPHGDYGIQNYWDIYPEEIFHEYEENHCFGANGTESGGQRIGLPQPN